MKKLIFILLLITGSTLLQAQLYQISNAASKNQLFIDLDKLYNFNLYEHSRWGLGLAYKKLGKTQSSTTYSAEGYGAYGVYDKRLKYGLQVDAQIHNKYNMKPAIGWFDDIEQAASRRWDSYHLLGISDNSNYLATRFSRVRRLYGEVTFNPWTYTVATVKAQYSWEKYLFSQHGPVYQWMDDYELMPTMQMAEIVFQLRNISGLRANLTLGHAHWDYQWRDPSGPIYTIQTVNYARLLMQYSKQYDISKHYKLTLLGQIGISSQDIPFSRMFDLGGSGGTLYFFNNTSMTILPNQFVCQNIAFANILIQRKSPWWNIPYSSPIPFLQLMGIWGNQWNSNQKLYSLLSNSFITSHNPTLEAVTLNAPYRGLYEIAAGLNRLLSYKNINLNIAAGYQITPRNVDYHHSDIKDNISLMLGASINIL